MDQNNLFVIQTVFAAIAAVAIVLQMAILFALYRAVKSMQDSVARTLPKVDALVARADETIPRVEALVAATTAAVDDSRKLIAMAREELARANEFIGETTTRARAQMDRVEMVLDETVDKAQQAVNAVTRGILRPVREVQGVAAGIQAAFTYLLNQSRSSVDRATSDEEMFI